MVAVNTGVVNEPGASSHQVGLTEFVRAQPDGYTLGLVSLPSSITVYLDPERKVVFGRKELQAVALQTI